MIMMSRFKRGVLGVLSVVPLICVFAAGIFFVMHPAAVRSLTSAGGLSPALYAGPGWGVEASLTGLLVAVVLWVYFCVRVIRASSVSAGGAAVWIAGLTLAGPLVFPLAWWRLERRDPL
jgi:hypothetical protein